MLYMKTQPQSFLGSEEENITFFHLPYIGIVAIFTMVWNFSFNKLALSLCQKTPYRPCRKKTKVPGIIILINVLDFESHDAIYQDSPTKLFGFWWRRVLSVCIICSRLLFCSVTRNLSNKLSISLRQKAPCVIWWKLVKRFQGRRHWNMTWFHTCIWPRGKGRKPPEGITFWL